MKGQTMHTPTPNHYFNYRRADFADPAYLKEQKRLHQAEGILLGGALFLLAAVTVFLKIFG
jgi:hypothetical protein